MFRFTLYKSFHYAQSRRHENLAKASQESNNDGLNKSGTAALSPEAGQTQPTPPPQSNAMLNQQSAAIAAAQKSLQSNAAANATKAANSFNGFATTMGAGATNLAPGTATVAGTVASTGTGAEAASANDAALAAQKIIRTATLKQQMLQQQQGGIAASAMSAILQGVGRSPNAAKTDTGVSVASPGSGGTNAPSPSATSGAGSVFGKATQETMMNLMKQAIKNPAEATKIVALLQERAKSLNQPLPPEQLKMFQEIQNRAAVASGQSPSSMTSPITYPSPSVMAVPSPNVIAVTSPPPVSNSTPVPAGASPPVAVTLLTGTTNAKSPIPVPASSSALRPGQMKIDLSAVPNPYKNEHAVGLDTMKSTMKPGGLAASTLQRTSGPALPPGEGAAIRSGIEKEMENVFTKQWGTAITLSAAATAGGKSTVSLALEGMEMLGVTPSQQLTIDDVPLDPEFAGKMRSASNGWYC
jgi:hypothetical protein